MVETGMTKTSLKKVLTQEEIDNLIRAARAGPETTGTAGEHPSVTVWDGRQTGQIGQEHMQTINRLHQTFAHNLTHSLGAYLRIEFEAALVSGEYLSYGDFLQSIPEGTYLASFKFMPVGLSVLLQMDLIIAYPLIDLLLGGEGKGAIPERNITEIEEQVLETVMHIIGRELQRAWQALSLESKFECRQHPGQVEQLMPATERTLILSFEVILQGERGSFNLVVPAQISNTLMRKTPERAPSKGRLRVESKRRLRVRLLNCPFEAELTLPSLRVPVRSLAELSVGTVLDLGRRADHPATLFVAGENLFGAHLARRGPVRAAQLQGRSPKAEAEGSQK
jgi:flagellar motor switch protein FliM